MRLLKRIKTTSIVPAVLLITIISLSSSCQKAQTPPLNIFAYTILDTLINQATSDSIAKSNDIFESISQHYDTSKFIANTIPLSEGKYVDIKTLNFPELAKNGYWDEINDTLKRSTVYLKWEQEFPNDTILNFLHSSDYRCTLWINDSCFFIEKASEHQVFYKRTNKISLKKGTNTFVLELTKRWKTRTAIMHFDMLSDKDAVSVLTHNINSGFLNRVLKPKDAKIYVHANILKGFIPDYKLTILCKGDTLLSYRDSCFSVEIPNEIFTEDNLSYSCVLSFNGHQARQPFIVGDIDTLCSKILTDTTLAKNSEIAPYLYRLNALVEAKKPTPRWRNKVAFVAEKINDANYRSTGITLNEFQSDIDETTQNYICITPEVINPKKNYPLIILFNPAFKYKSHLLTSIYLHKIWVLNYTKSLCNLNDYIVLMTSNRSYNNEGMTPIGETDIVEAIENAKKFYPIDTTKVFLYGSCLGARKVLSFASHTPLKYSGIALYNPSMDRVESLDLSTIKHTPIYIHHDRYDTHTPIENSEYLIKLCKKAHVPTQTNLNSYGRNSYFNYAIDQDVFSFFNSIENKNHTRKKKKHSSEKQVKHFFSKRFYIVYGTKGTSNNFEVACELQNQWKDYYYQPCRLVADTAAILTKDTNANLLLIGNHKTNHITYLFSKDDKLNDFLNNTDIFFNRNREYTYEYLFDKNDRQILLIGSAISENIKYNFAHKPWFYGNYTSKAWNIYDFD